MKHLLGCLFLTVVTVALATNTASAATVWSTTLLGSNEVPATGSAGTGSALVSLTGNNLSISITFSGLGSPDGAGHIHCCGAVGTNQAIAVPFSGFPTGLTSGSYSSIFDLTQTASYSAAFLSATGGTASAAEAALLAGLDAGQGYVNIHTTQFPGGEIRGQLAAVPEPGTMLLGGLALSTIALLRRRSLLK